MFFFTFRKHGNGSQSNIIDRRDLAEEHIWDSCMYKRPWNLRTSGSNRYENNARRSGGGGYITPWKTRKRTYLRGKSSYSEDSSISGFEISCSTTLLLQCVIQNWYFYPKTAILWKRMKTRAFITAVSPWKIVVQWWFKYTRTRNFITDNFVSTMCQVKFIFLLQNGDFGGQKHENGYNSVSGYGHISVENRRTVMIQIYTNS